MPVNIAGAGVVAAQAARVGMADWDQSPAGDRATRWSTRVSVFRSAPLPTRRLRAVRYWVANTDRSWFEFLAARAPLDEVNFWAPNPVPPIRLPTGGPWLFKLHMREGGQIVGGAYFAHHSVISPRFAWDAFGEANGTDSMGAFARRLSQYSGRRLDLDNSAIGSSILVEPFFLPTSLWIDSPLDWSSNLTRGKSYDSTVGEGALLWQRVDAARAITSAPRLSAIGEPQAAAYGTPALVAPRLGQGAFRVIVTDAYERRCAVTGERTLPVLEAAHIKPFNLVQKHDVSNGLLLRSDLHTLFDRGYITVTPDRHVLVSKRIREEFENGRDYYALHGRELRVPASPAYRPAPDALDWHASHVFKG